MWVIVIVQHSSKLNKQNHLDSGFCLIVLLGYVIWGLCFIDSCVTFNSLLSSVMKTEISFSIKLDFIHPPVILCSTFYSNSGIVVVAFLGVERRPRLVSRPGATRGEGEECFCSLSVSVPPRPPLLFSSLTLISVTLHLEASYLLFLRLSIAQSVNFFSCFR